MGEVRCFYKWDEKKARQLSSWVQKDPHRFLVFVEDDPQVVILETPHPRIRCISVSQKGVFENLSREYLYLPFSFEQNHPILREFATVQAEVNYRATDFADQGLQLLKNIKSHLLQLTGLARDLYGQFKNIPAVVCGGAPSISKVQIPNGALVIGCGAGVEALLKRGIKPHLAAHVDPCCLHRFSQTDIPLLYQLRTHEAVTNQYKGPRFLSAGPGNFPLESSLQEKWGLESSLDGGWTVGTYGAVMAYLMGCNPIILAGMDLCTSGSLYAPGVKTEATAKNFMPMKNRLGRSVQSRPDWVLAAEWLHHFAKTHSEVEWGTLAEEGLDIPSIPWVQSIPSSKQPISIPVVPQIRGKELWEEIEKSFQQVHKLCLQMLQEMEKIFPQLPYASGALAVLEHDMSQELAFQQVLEPIWAYWAPVIDRNQDGGEYGLYLHKLLFFQSICEKVHAL